MSLVNEMLQDLQERQATDARPLAGLRAVRAGDMAGPAQQPRIGVWLLAGLFVVAGTVAAAWLRTNAPRPETAGAIATLPADYVAVADIDAGLPGESGDEPVVDAPAALNVVTTGPDTPAATVEAAGVPLPGPAEVAAVVTRPVAVVASTTPVVAAVPKQRVMPPRTKRESGKAAAVVDSGVAEAGITKVAVPPQTRLRSNGLTAMRAGRRAEAAAYFRQLVALQPADTQAHLLLHAALTAQLRTDAGRDALRAALGVAAQPDAVAQVLARELLAERKTAQAVAVLEQHRPAAYTDLEYEATLAAAYQRAGRHTESARVYSELVGIEPGQGTWWVGLAISQEAGGDTTGARDSYATAIRAGSLKPALASYAGRRLARLEGGS